MANKGSNGQGRGTDSEMVKRFGNQNKKTQAGSMRFDEETKSA